NTGDTIYIRSTKQWGTGGDDAGRSVAVDTAGNIFVVGQTEGAIDGNTNFGGIDIFLTKFNSDGSFAWTKQWGTSEIDVGVSVAVDGLGNIFVSGYTDGDLDGNLNDGSVDIFLTKFYSDGSFAWTKQWGTSGQEYGQSVAVDNSGNIFVTGYTDGDLDGNTNAGSSDIFLTKLKSDGSFEWTQQWGTIKFDTGNSLLVDSSGNIFITGHTSGTFDGNTDSTGIGVFLTKLSDNGSVIWTKQWGTGENDYGESVSIDSFGNIFVAGHTNGDVDGYNIVSRMFLTKLNSDGSEVWIKVWGSNGDDEVSCLTIDSSGNIFVAGYAEGAFDGNTNAGGYDIFLTKLNSDRTVSWTDQWGTIEDDYGQSVAVDNFDNVFVVGYTHGDLDENTSAGGYDIFLSIFSVDGL
ncbi:MAG TPA: SBBP repeat-containing protein, partial [bacterium]|nr:SBBP repeat-containing protein [bacterium]HPS30605.1 SBBP repeat-containing protein [bacterium]